MDARPAHEPLAVETLPDRLAIIDALAGQVCLALAAWPVEEVGDGKLNLVFIVNGPEGAAIVKQASPYVRLPGDSWPLPLNRPCHAHHALRGKRRRARARCPKSTPSTRRGRFS